MATGPRRRYITVISVETVSQMSRDTDTDPTGEFELASFERNRYFEGKLLTADDMAAEQRYHAGRADATTRFLAGAGILSGLHVESVESVDETIRVTVSPGVAVDSDGRLLLVPNTTTERLDPPAGDEIHLQLSYDEYQHESVPVPGADRTGHEDTAFNRLLEVFELHYTESPPMTTRPTPDLDLPSAAALRAMGAEAAAGAVAEQYHEAYRAEPATPGSPAVFLGAFERGDDDTWQPAEDAPTRRFVYDNEMLAALLFAHLSDTDSPHGGGDGGAASRVPEELSELDQLQTEVTELEGTVAALQRERATFERYAMRKSLKDTVRLFDRAADRFTDLSGEASKVAREIADVTQDAVGRAVHTDDEQFRGFVARLLELQRELGDALEPAVTTESLERYFDELNAQQAALDGETSGLTVAMAQDGVAEAVDSVAELYDVVPDS